MLANSKPYQIELPRLFFDEIISRVCEKLKFRYAFLDGKYGLDQNGPLMGDPVEVNWFVASNSLGAFDMIVSEMMGFDR